jgi:hypothetical protein
MYNSGKFAQLFPRLSVPHSVSCEMAGNVSMPVDEAATFGYPRERSF